MPDRGRTPGAATRQSSSPSTADPLSAQARASNPPARTRHPPTARPRPGRTATRAPHPSASTRARSAAHSASGASSRSRIACPPDRRVGGEQPGDHRIGVGHRSHRRLHPIIGVAVFGPALEDRRRLGVHRLQGRHAALPDRRPALPAQQIHVDRMPLARCQPGKGGPRLRRRGGVVKLPDPGNAHRRDTKRTRLAGGVELAAGQIHRAELARRIADRLYLAMRGRVEVLQRPVDALADDPAVLHDHRTERLGAERAQRLGRYLDRARMKPLLYITPPDGSPRLRVA